MHDEGVIHSDIKADNVLISNTGLPLICDFGISRLLAASQTLDMNASGQLRGSPRWMAIELFSGEGDSHPTHTLKTDVWAFGMTTYVCLMSPTLSFYLTHTIGASRERTALCEVQA